MDDNLLASTKDEDATKRIGDIDVPGTKTLVERLHATNSAQIQRGPAASARQRGVGPAGSA